MPSAQSRAPSSTITSPTSPRRTTSLGPRYAIYGDSTALAVALGLDGWAREHPSVLRETAGFAQLGCGLQELTRDIGDGLSPYPAECVNWPSRWKEAAIKANAAEPTTAVIILGPWEVTDVTLPGTNTPTSFGDPAYDAAERAALAHGVDVLLEHSPAVLMLTSPYVERGRVDGRSPERQVAMSDPQRMDRWNAIIREVAARNPTRVGVVEYARYIAKRAADDARLRPDGIHLTWDTATEVATWLGPEVSRSIKALDEERAK